MNPTVNPTGPRYRRTKIVATVGPASKSASMVEALIKTGVNVFRLNFSHGSPEEHFESLTTIRKVSSEIGIPVAILQDLSGPKIRITQVDEARALVGDGQEILLRHATSKEQLSSAEIIYVEAVDPPAVVHAGHQVLLADGSIVLKAISNRADGVLLKVVKGGKLRSKVGIAFPDSTIDLPAATEKDLRDMAWGLKNGIDFVALSFVKTAEDITGLRSAMERENIAAQRPDVALPGIIAKIELRRALDNIKEIMDVSDGIMVARGDLGLELPLERLPLVQRRLIEEANFRGIPVIVATQMLHSMITAVRPTRAEVSDIALAVMSGADAVMLSEETSIGEHPIEAVDYIGRIAAEAEQAFAFEEYKLRLRNSDHNTVSDAVAYAACAAALKVNAAAIVVCTQTGASARLVAKYRPQQSLYGTSSKESTIRRLALYWGVHPIPCSPTSTHQEEIANALKTVQINDQLPNGSLAVVTGGLSVGRPGSTSVLEIRELSYA